MFSLNASSCILRAKHNASLVHKTCEKGKKPTTEGRGGITQKEQSISN